MAGQDGVRGALISGGAFANGTGQALRVGVSGGVPMNNLYKGSGGSSNQKKKKKNTSGNTNNKNKNTNTGKQKKQNSKAAASIEERLKDTLDKMKEEIDEVIGDFEHDIFMLEKHKADPSEIVAVYRKMQKYVNEQADAFRAKGLEENSDYIQDLQKQWWDYEDNIVDTMSDAYDKIIKELENAVEQNERWMNNAIENARKDVKTVPGVRNHTIEETKKLIPEGSIEEAKKAVQDYSDVLAQASQWGINASKTVFGNINTANRQVIRWTSDNLAKFNEELTSWGQIADSLQGTSSDVFTRGKEYDGVKVSFSPILQTDSGPVLLSQDTVDGYIKKLIENAKVDGELSFDNVMQLDSEGLEIDGQKIKNLLADIGDKAYETGYAMQYVANDGMLNNATKSLEEFAKKYSLTSTDLVNYVNSLTGGSVTAPIGSGVSLGYSITKQLEPDIVEAEKNAKAIIGFYQEMQQKAHEEAERYRKMGYSDTSDEVAELSKAWWDYADNIKDVKQQIFDNLIDMVEAASDTVDDIQDVLSTFQTAADDYAKSGFISVDAFQDISKLGLENMQYLKDENGQLSINKDKIYDVIAAKTEQLAVTTALNYVERLRLASEAGSIEDLDNLLTATKTTTTATWGLVYANLALTSSQYGWSQDMYQAALDNINAYYALAKNVKSWVDADDMDKMKDGFKDIIDYVIDMLEDQINRQIDDLEDLKDKYADIIDLKKESLELAKKETEYQDSVADKVKEIAKIQEQISALSLDTSRDATSKRASLEEQLTKLQKELAEDQADYAYDKQTDSLDKMQEAYEDQKDAEIKKLEESISSYQKKYDMAIEYIKTHWNTLLDELTAWNSEYGSVLNDEISSAWDSCLAAAERYGGYLEAIAALSKEIADTSGKIGIGNSGDNNNLGNSNYGKTNSEVGKTITQMYQNSQAWHSASDEGKKNLSEENSRLGKKLQELGVNAYRDDVSGTWFVNGKKLYDAYNDYISGNMVFDNKTPVTPSLEEEKRSIITSMYRNTQEWKGASKERQKQLSDKNYEYGRQLNALGIKAYRDEESGIWYVGGKKLYDAYKYYTSYAKYHTGGVVGDVPDKKPNEVVALLENGEIVLDKKKQESLYRVVDFVQILSEKLGTQIKSLSSAGNADKLTKHMRAAIPSGSAYAIDNSKRSVVFGDTYIYGGNDDTVQQHKDVTRKFVNEVLDKLNIRK